MSDVFAPVVQRLAAQLSGERGGAAVAVRPVRTWTRAFSHLMRARVEGAKGLDIVYVKIVRPRSPAERDTARTRLERDVRTTRRLSHHLQPPFGVPLPVAWFPDLLAVVTAEARGIPLSTALGQRLPWRRVPDPQLLSWLRMTGRWIAAFQRQMPRGGQVTPDELIAYLDVRLMKLRARHARFGEHDRQTLLERFGLWVHALDADDLAQVAVHADMAPGNVLVDEGGVTVLDFAMVRTGYRLHDLAHLWVHLEAMTAKPQFRPQAIAALQAALVSGFDATLRVESPAFACARMINEVNHFAALAVRGSTWAAAPYDWYVKRRHLVALRQLAAPLSGRNH